jgi:gentisate 1,2-dioxygenase
VAGTAAQFALALSLEAWKRVSAGDGTEGPRLYDWAYIELADLEAAEDNPDNAGFRRAVVLLPALRHPALLRDVPGGLQVLRHGVRGGLHRHVGHGLRLVQAAVQEDASVDLVHSQLRQGKTAFR